MNREQSNLIRTVIEDWFPAVLRDSRLFQFAARQVWGEHIDALADFRSRAPFVGAEEYRRLYEKHPRVHEGTDNSQACIEQILQDIAGTSVCDVGCGTGELLSRVRGTDRSFDKLTGVDFVVSWAQAIEGVDYVAASIEHLPFADDSFDTVICTHVIEHILDYRRAIAELRRIARKRLIIVVPREREFRYSFNPHFNFFPYTHSFLRAMQPVPAQYHCRDIKRDIYYREDLA
jgi:SAM-dependent methyltransferase